MINCLNYSYIEYYNYVLTYCKQQNIQILNYDIQKYIKNNNLIFFGLGGESLVFINKDKSYVYKFYELYRNYCVIQKSDYYLYDLISKNNRLNVEYKLSYDVKLVACCVVENIIYLIYKQPYVKPIENNCNKYILEYKINKFFNLDSYQISTYKNNKDIFIIKNDIVLADIGKHNLTLKDNQIFIYDMNIYKLDKNELSKTV